MDDYPMSAAISKFPIHHHHHHHHHHRVATRYRSISSVISLLISTSTTKSFHHHHRPNFRAVHKQPILIDFRLTSTSMAQQQPEGMHDSWEAYRDKVIQNCVLPLSYDTSYKGSSGRIAILGGNELYVGAPYFCGMASLQTGADLASVYTAEEATIPIKCYSPDLMVQSIYRASDLPSLNINNNNIDNTNTDFSNHPMVKKIVDNAMHHLKQRHIHCVVIGPGMGRHPLIMTAMSRIITRIILMPNMYLILDADALYMLSLPQYRDLVSGYSNVIITPNQMEYNRLFGNGVYDNSTNRGLNSAAIVKKGRTDRIYRHDRFGYFCSEVGGMKRCGGLGDVLAGTIATFIAWRGILNRFDDVEMTNQEDNVMLACYAACCLVKRATKRAYDNKHRAMSAQDVIHEIGRTFHDMIDDGDQ